MDEAASREQALGLWGARQATRLARLNIRNPSTNSEQLPKASRFATLCLRK
jgi:hypothetical protein